MKAMDERSFARGFLIDGFPRNQNNLDGWKREMADKTKICFVLYMACTIEVISSSFIRNNLRFFQIF